MPKVTDPDEIAELDREWEFAFQHYWHDLHDAPKSNLTPKQLKKQLRKQRDKFWKKSKALPPVLGVAHLAEFLGVTPVSIRHELDRGAVKRGRLPQHLRRAKGGHYRWKRSTVLAFYRGEDAKG